MTDELDVRGLSCPAPVIETRRKMKQIEKGTFKILVDTDTALENISRLATGEGWKMEVAEEGTGYRIVLEKE